MGKKRFLLVLASLFVLVAFGPATIQGENTCGDANGDGHLNVGDAVFMINYVFKGGPAPDSICCPDCSNCTDGTLNGSETDVDCGGPDCPPCSDGSICVSGSDCLSGVCSGGICQPPTCNDGVQNGEETDIDCGGPECPPCGNNFD